MNFEFVRWQRSINDAKCTVLPLFSCLQRSPHFSYWLSSAAMLVFYRVFHTLCPPAAFASGNFMAWGIGINLRTRLQWPNQFIPFPAIWSSWYLRRDPSMRLLVDSSASTMQAYIVLHFFSILQVSRYFSRWVLQGIAANFLSAFSRRVQFDSGFHKMTVNRIAWNGPEIIPSITITSRWVSKWSWRRPVWFALKITLFFSSVWAIPDQSGCSQNLISSTDFYRSIYDSEYKIFSIHGR